MLGIVEHLYRLVPANPIFLRVVSTAGKRRRDAMIRFGYLGLLTAWAGLMLVAMGSITDMGELAKSSATIFKQASYLQLALVALLAPIFTAGAITQEKDSQTYDILLTTPLSNGQIILGTLLSRVFFIVALLLSGLPVFSVTRIFGGVGLDNILTSFGIAAATAFLTGAMAVAIATFRLGTRRTIFFFYLAIIGFLVGGFVLDNVAWFQVAGQPSINNMDSHISWFTAVHPFLALRASFGDPAYVPPLAADLPASLRYWPVSWYLTSPHSFYITASFVVGLVLVVPSIILMRRVAQATMNPRTWILTKLHLSSGNNVKKPRYVWHNPVAWREARTKASAARMGVIRALMILASVLLAGWLLWRFSTIVSPARYIDSTSLNVAEHSVTILEANKAPTYRLADNFDLMLNDKRVEPDSIRGRYSVKAFSVDPKDKSAIAVMELLPIQRSLPLESAQLYLLSLLIVEMSAVLIVVTNEAASTVTREREDGSLDLLLTTPITSRFYIWGKLRGLVSLAWPLNAVPVATIGAFVVYDIFRWFAGADSTFRWVVLPEALLLLPVMLVLITALAAIIGMQTSMRCRRTITAVMLSVLLVAVVIAIPASIGMATISGNYRSAAALAVAAFSPVSTLCALVNSSQFGGQVLSGEDPDAYWTGRIIMTVFGLVACGAYAGVVYALYRTMVRNFDMMIRKQQR